MLDLSFNVFLFLLLEPWDLLNNWIIRLNLVTMDVMINRWFWNIRSRKLFLLDLGHSIFMSIQNAIILLLKEWLSNKLCLSNFHCVFIISEWVIRQLILIIIEIYDSSKFLMSLHHLHQAFILIWLEFLVHNLESITNSIVFSLQSSKTCQDWIVNALD